MPVEIRDTKEVPPEAVLALFRTVDWAETRTVFTSEPGFYHRFGINTTDQGMYR